MKIFSEEGIGEFKGLFSIDHLLFTLISLILVIVLLIIFRKSTKTQVEKIIKIVFIVVFVLEVLKIVWNFLAVENLEIMNWVPLFYCSFFLYASGVFVLFGKNQNIRHYAVLSIVYGQMFAGLMFILYPSTSIGIRPFVHIMTFHSLIYHTLSSFVGLLLVITNYYDIKEGNLKKDFLKFFIPMFIATCFVYLFNIIFNSNMMLLNDPIGIPPLEILKNIFGLFYPLIIALGQILGTFIGGYVIIILKKTITKD